MNLEQDYFKLFGLEPRFDLDAAALQSIRQRARELQRQYHPDRLGKATPAERQLAAQFSAQVNSAVRTLREPVARAAHILELAGIHQPIGEHTIKDAAFLIQQMELREQLEDAADAGDKPALAALAESVEQHYAATRQQFAEVTANFAELALPSNETARQQALALLGKLQFFQKLQDEIEAAVTRN